MRRQRAHCICIPKNAWQRSALFAPPGTSFSDAIPKSGRSSCNTRSLPSSPVPWGETVHGLVVQERFINPPSKRPRVVQHRFENACIFRQHPASSPPSYQPSAGPRADGSIAAARRCGTFCSLASVLICSPKALCPIRPAPRVSERNNHRATARALPLPRAARAPTNRLILIRHAHSCGNRRDFGE